MNEIAPINSGQDEAGISDALPHNIEAEQQLLGAILTNNDITTVSQPSSARNISLSPPMRAFSKLPPAGLPKTTLPRLSR